MITRRRLLGTSAALTLAWPGLPTLAAQTRDPRLVLVILRGGLDGLAAVPPYGDPDYRRARRGLAEGAPDEVNGVLDLDGFFGLNGSMRGLHGLYRSRELVVVHAVAPPYQARSHFDAQDVLETGLASPSALSDGWLYRALGTLPGAPDPAQRAMALGGGIPLVLRGDKPVSAWAPEVLPAPDDETLHRVLALYDEDPVLGPSAQTGFATNDMLDPVAAPGRGAGRGDDLAVAARAAAGFLKHPDGPRIAVVDGGGWDTHANQQGQLGVRLGRLDQVIVSLRDGLGADWASTVVVVVSEFGRTVAMNGTRGSDHGVGGVGFVAGGAVQGGQVIADWPGLAPGKLFEGRDLQPTLDVRSVFRTVLVEHLGVDANAVDERVFTDALVDGLPGLIRA